MTEKEHSSKLPEGNAASETENVGSGSSNSPAGAGAATAPTSTVTVDMNKDEGIVNPPPPDATTPKNKNKNNDQNTKTKKKPAIRHVEKRRKSSGKFADRLARLSIEHYRTVVPETFREQQQQTCLATILAHHALTGQVCVLALGVGTKFLTQAVLEQEQKEATQRSSSTDDTPSTRLAYGRRVRDCHAEVLCRRAFRRYLSCEILKDLMRKGESGEQRQDDEDQNDESPFRILERVESDNNNNNLPSHPTWKLAEHVSLHAYCSSTPCGNAALKRFASLQDKIVIPADDDENTWRSDAPHPVQHPHSIALGQFALLVKHDRTAKAVVAKDTNDDNPTIAATVTDDEHVDRKGEKATTTNKKQATDNATTTKRTASSSSKPPAPALTNTDWCPPGTTTVWNTYHNMSQGSIHTCSDKLCRWNCLGWQGSLLSRWIPQPLHVDTVVVGRKLSMACCRRALCCRVQTAVTKKTDATTDATMTTVNRDTPSDKNQKKTKKQRAPPKWTLSPPHDQVNHPTILSNAVYMDESAAVVVQQNQVGQDVRFHSTLCWVWWSTTGNTSFTAATTAAVGTTTGAVDSSRTITEAAVTTSTTTLAQAINGSTGFRVAPTDLPVSGKQQEGGETNDIEDSLQNQTEEKEATLLSAVCTQELLQLYLEIGRHTAMAITTNQRPYKNLFPVQTLADLRGLKRQATPLYEANKDKLLTLHPILKQWKRRENGVTAATTSGEDVS